MKLLNGKTMVNLNLNRGCNIYYHTQARHYPSNLVMCCFPKIGKIEYFGNKIPGRCFRNWKFCMIFLEKFNDCKMGLFFFFFFFLHLEIHRKYPGKGF